MFIARTDLLARRSIGIDILRKLLSVVNGDAKGFARVRGCNTLRGKKSESSSPDIRL